MIAQSNTGSNNKSALLVIDVQSGLFERPVPIYNASGLLQNITSLVEQAHRKSIPVVYIQHSGERILIKNSPAWQLHPQIQLLKVDSIVHKSHGNAFEDTILAEVLRKDNITTLVITGLVTHGCVKATCLGALQLGYKVVLVSDAHSNYSRQASKIIREWNQKSGTMGIELRSTAEINFN